MPLFPFLRLHCARAGPDSWPHAEVRRHEMAKAYESSAVARAMLLIKYTLAGAVAPPPQLSAQGRYTR